MNVGVYATGGEGEREEAKLRTSGGNRLETIRGKGGGGCVEVAVGFYANLKV